MKKYLIYPIIICLVFILSSCTSVKVAHADTFEGATLRVKLQSDYLHDIYPEASKEWCVAVSAVNYVSNYVSPRLFAYCQQQNIVISNTNIALQYGAGICGIQTFVYLDILHNFNVLARSVQCFDIDDAESNHIFAEVWYNDKWNMFDCTMGCYYVSENGTMWNNMSFEEVRNTPDYLNHVVNNELNIFTMGYTGAGIDPYSYITSNTTRIVYGAYQNDTFSWLGSSAPVQVSQPTPDIYYVPQPSSPSAINFGGLSLDDNGVVIYDKEVISGNGLLNINIPAGVTALNKDGNVFRIVRINESSENISGDMVSVYDVQPSGAEFNPGINLELSYKPDEYNDPQIVAWNGTAWNTVESAVKGNVIQCKVNKLSKFALVNIPKAEEPDVKVPKEVGEITVLNNWWTDYPIIQWWFQIIYMR